MPAWDNCLDQIATLPVAPAIDAAADRLLYVGSTRSAGQAAALRDIPHALVWSLQASAVNVSPTASLTTRKDGFGAPYTLHAMRLVLTVTTQYGTGSQPWFDVADESQSPIRSLLSNAGLASGSGASLPTTTATLFVDDPVDKGGVTVSTPIGLYCSTASSTNLGSTWGHLIYVLQ